MRRYHIVRTGFSGYWGEEFQIMFRGRVVATALSLVSAKAKLEEFQRGNPA